MQLLHQNKKMIALKKWSWHSYQILSESGYTNLMAGHDNFTDFIVNVIMDLNFSSEKLFEEACIF